MNRRVEQRASQEQIDELYPVRTWDNGLGFYWYFNIDPDNLMAGSKIEFFINTNKKETVRVIDQKQDGNSPPRDATLEELVSFVEKAAKDIPDHNLFTNLTELAKRRWEEERDRSARLGYRLFRASGVDLSNGSSAVNR